MKNFSNKKWSRREIIIFLERLEMYVSAGLVLDKALSVVGNSMTKNRKSAVELVRHSVEQGGSVSVAFNKYIKIPVIITALIRHGELSGQFSKSLLISRNLIEREDELIKKSLSAMTYPLVIAIFAGLLTIGLLRGVMPQIIPMLKSLNVKLPLITHLVIAVSEGVVSYGIYILISTVLVFSMISWIYRRFFKFKKIIQIILMKVPIFGKLVFNYHFSIFLRSLGSLVETEFSISTSYAKVIETISFLPLKTIFDSQISNIDGGISFGKILKHKYIPEYISSLIVAGEDSGFLAISLIRSADILDRDIEHDLKKITSLIEPVMMIAMGCIVGAIALSIMMPIYDISKTLQR